MLQTMWRKVPWMLPLRARLVPGLLVPLFAPAYSIRDSEMRPVTKISIFGVRLGIAVLAAYWCLIFVGTHLPGVAAVAPRVNDKWQHFSAFFLLGLLLCYVTNSPRWWSRFTTIGLVGMAYAAVDEFTQRYIPGRYPDTRDFLADAVGIWTAVLCYMAIKFTWEALRPTQA